MEHPSTAVDKGLLIIGGQGTGKSVLARKIAEFIGGEYREVGAKELERSKFAFFTPKTKVLIVDEYRNEPSVKALVSNDKVTCMQKGKEDVLIDPPKIICTSLHKPRPDDRRFIVIDLGGAL